MKFTSTLKIFIFCFLFFAVCRNAMAQRIISGTIRDSITKQPLVGASIIELSALRGAQTDVNGKFSFQATDSAKQVVISFPGYETLYTNISLNNQIDTFLVEKVPDGDDITICTIYTEPHLHLPFGGTIDRDKLGGAISKVNYLELNRDGITDPIQMLQGKVAGLDISKSGSDPNGNFTARIRGLNTLVGSTEPLYILDDVPNVSLQSIDVNDIETMTVLKDGSAAVLYGARANGGVVLITTKHGTRNQKLQIDYKSEITTSTITNAVQNLSPDEYAAALTAAGGKPGDARTNWLEQISRTGISNNQNLAISGAPFKNTIFRFSGNYRNVQGNLINKDGYKQLSGRFNVQQSLLKDKLHLNLTFNSENRDGVYGIVEAFRYAVTYNPTLAPMGGINSGRNGGYTQLEEYDTFNPLAIVNQSTDNFTNKNDQLALSASLEIMEGLKLKGLYSFNRNSYSNSEFYPSTSYFRGEGNDATFSSNYLKHEQYLQTYLQYNNNFNKLQTHYAAGYDGQKYDNTSLYLSHDFRSNPFYVKNLHQESQLAAFFGNAHMSYNNMVSVSGTYRREGYSGFADGNKWGNYGSVGVNINLVNAIGHSDFFSAFNVRAAYSISGGLPPTTNLSQTGFTADGAGNFSIPRNPSPNLKNESKRELNMGIDWSINSLGNFSGAIDYYTRNLSDLIYNFNSYPVGSYDGNNLWLNAGSLTSSGVEARLSFDFFRDYQKGWRSTFLLSTNTTALNVIKTDVLQVSKTNNLVIGNCGCGVFQPSTLIEPGKSLGQIWTYQYAGVNSAGAPLVYNSDGTPISINAATDKDKKVVGNGLPKLTLGWSNDVHYKAISLSANFIGAFGHSLINAYRANYEDNNVNSILQYNRVKTKYWDPTFTQAATTSYDVESASYLRLNYLQLAYTIDLSYPQKFLKKLRVYIASTNVFTLTGYSGIDPSVSYGYTPQTSQGSLLRGVSPNPLFPGDDNLNTYVLARTISVGVNVGF